MAASPASPTYGVQPTARPASLTEWLRRRPDRQLARLLQLRPDLALPAPPDISSLAGRLGVRTSTQRAIDGLDAYLLQILEHLVLAAGPDDIVIDSVQRGAARGVEELFDRALVWGELDLVHLAPTVRESIGPYPGGLGRRAATLFGPGTAMAGLLAEPHWITAQLAQLDPSERDVLDRLAAGPPVGTVRNTRLAAADTDLSPPHRLINRGLLVPIDMQRVELPREVGRALRAGAVELEAAQRPPIRLVEREPAELDRLGTTAVQETLRLVDGLAESWTAHPPAMLRSGGVGVRDLKRAAKDLGVDEAMTALVAETAYAAGLVNSTTGPQPVFLPSAGYDGWRARRTAQRWTSLAAAWVAMTRQPSLVSMRGERDRVITALGPDAERGTTPALRRQVLDLLAGLPPGSSPDDRSEVLALLAWHQPRRASGQRPLVEAILAEADLLGVTAAGGLTGYARTLLAGWAAAADAFRSSAAADAFRSSAAADALERALPDAVDHFLVQPDLTVVVPGPPEPAMGTELGLVADLESTGGASVYRITERTVRRALDAGRSGDELAAFVATRSRTPVPQALQYLIEDAARRHGVLRAGSAGCYLRCDDTALLTRVLSDRGVAPLHLRPIAPTVVVADAPVTKVLEVLRDAGFAPAAESPGGDLITLGIDAPRSPMRPAARAMTARGAAETEAQLTELVRRIRSGDALAGMDHRVHPIAQQVPGVTSAATMELLRRAVREAQLVWFGCAETDGSATAHTIQPISLAAGTVRGYERGKVGLVSYPVHRITSIRVLDEDDADLDEDDADEPADDLADDLQPRSAGAPRFREDPA